MKLPSTNKRQLITLLPLLTRAQQDGDLERFIQLNQKLHQLELFQLDRDPETDRQMKALAELYLKVRDQARAEALLAQKELKELPHTRRAIHAYQEVTGR
ncbi:hypothetical protein [Dongshaea marina]|uniref:hypothetical protein n=1 Tax=Dongshaea marina TaxID=2047966 RepID=UPI000D3E0573|nr:hypothetical protein [Dongshaea marina]